MRNSLAIICLVVCALCSCVSRPQKSWLADELTERQLDSLSFYGNHHYTNNYNFIVSKDSIELLTQQPEEMISELPTDTFSVYKHDLLVVADIRVIPDDAVDSVWVQVAKDQLTFGWIHESELLDGVVPDDPISQFIAVFSDVHLIIFLILAIFSAGIFLPFKLKKKNVRMPILNDIDTFYPMLLCITVAFSASFYATIQLFAPQMWEHFFFNPTLNPFNVPFPLNFFLASVWALLIIGLATVDDVRRHLPFVEAFVYLCVLAVLCAINYVVFSISTLYYIGYPLLAAYVFAIVAHFLRYRFKPYLCGNCGSQMRKKGRCPHCGTMNY